MEIIGLAPDPPWTTLHDRGGLYPWAEPPTVSYGMVASNVLPYGSVTRATVATALSVTSTLPFASVVGIEVESVALAVRSSIVTCLVRTGMGWFDISAISSRRQPFGACHFTPTWI